MIKVSLPECIGMFILNHPNLLIMVKGFLPTVDPRSLWLKLKFRLKFRSNLFKILFMSELISKLATTEEIKRYLSAEIFMHFISALALSNRQFDEEK